MKSTLSSLLIWLILGALLASGCGASTLPADQAPTAAPAEVVPVAEVAGGGDAGEDQAIGLPNPASVYCEEQGYQLEMRTDAQGNQFGICLFPDGSECDEWAFLRGECAPASGAGQTVVGWLGYVESLPAGSQWDDRLVLSPAGAGEIGVEAAEPSVAGALAALRDQPEPGKYAHFWGTLICDVPDVGGCQLQVSRIRAGATATGPEPVEAWEGTLVSNPPGAQFDDYFVLQGDFAVGFGIHSLDVQIQSQLEALRGTNQPFKVWGQLRTGVPDAFGSQIEVTRIAVP
jgi:putative hemolysin